MPRQALDAQTHFIQGTKSEAKPAAPALPGGRPKYPKGISAEAKVVFKRLVKVLESRRASTPGDAELIHLYAIAHVRHQRAQAKLDVEGEVRVYTRLDSNGQPHDQEKHNLHLKVAQDAERSMVACLDRLGLTPMNREKIEPTAPIAPAGWTPDPLGLLKPPTMEEPAPRESLDDFEYPEIQ